MVSYSTTTINTKHSLAAPEKAWGGKDKNLLKEPDSPNLGDKNCNTVIHWLTVIKMNYAQQNG